MTQHAQRPLDRERCARLVPGHEERSVEVIAQSARLLVDQACVERENERVLHIGAEDARARTRLSARPVRRVAQSARHAGGAPLGYPQAMRRSYACALAALWLSALGLGGCSVCRCLPPGGWPDGGTDAGAVSDAP